MAEQQCDSPQVPEISIRHSKEGDIEGIFALYGQRSCYAGTLQRPYPSLAFWQKRLKDLPENCYSLVAVREGKIVGQLGMEVYSNARRKHVANFGMAVCELARGQGIGSALLAAMIDLATNWLAVRRIELEVYTDNQAAIALYKSHGFEIEGEAKDYAFRDGGYVNAFLMARCC
ncbi:GNAT family N-acetyltransferase [Shewanella insulae]|uniref:GNAT family N-acetyltransferase n=1 Tax=Shewanella insulae TaxID=2681496 RepID=UPI001EFC9760|nr:GNAT family N-acetyltransferase [Shewanella insulae]MCG9756790.1 GNAT family N-acetyltransferase [Shewanella insulae]